MSYNIYCEECGVVLDNPSTCFTCKCVLCDQCFGDEESCLSCMDYYEVTGG